MHFGETDIKEILDVRGFNLNATLEIDPDFLTDSHHHHDDDISSFVFTSERALDMAKIEAFLSLLIQTYGNDMLRYKGVLNIEKQDKRMIFQGVHDHGRQPRQAVVAQRKARIEDGVHRPQSAEESVHRRPGVLRGGSERRHGHRQVNAADCGHAARRAPWRRCDAVSAAGFFRRVRPAHTDPWPSGSGQDHLAQPDRGLTMPAQGGLRFRDQVLASLTETQRDRLRGQHMGFVLQRLHLIGALSVLDNLVLARKLAGLEIDTVALHALLDRLGLSALRSACRPVFRKENRNAWPWRAQWLTGPHWCWPMNPPRHSTTPNCAAAMNLMFGQAAEMGCTLIVATHDKRIRDRFSNDHIAGRV